MNELFNHFEGVIGAGTLLQQAVMLLAVSLLRVYAVFLVLPATSDQALQGPVRNGLWVWAVYRTTDVGLVLAAIAMHAMTGGGDLDHILGDEPWPASRTARGRAAAISVG